VRGRDLVGATEGLGVSFALWATVSADFCILSNFSNRGAKLRAVVEEYPHYGGCRIATHDDEQARDDPCPECGRGSSQGKRYLLWERVQVSLPNPDRR
jgi:hypothetical protein